MLFWKIPVPSYISLIYTSTLSAEIQLLSQSPAYHRTKSCSQAFSRKGALVSTDKNKEALTKYTNLWDGIKNSFQKINNKSNGYGKYFKKIKFNSDDSLPLNKTLKLHNMTIIVRSVFEKDGKYYPQVFLDECLYEL